MRTEPPSEELQTAVVRYTRGKSLSSFLYLAIPFLHCLKVSGRPKTGWAIFALWRDDWDLSLLGLSLHGPKWSLTALSYLFLVGVFALATLRFYSRVYLDESLAHLIRSRKWLLAQWTAFLLLTPLAFFVAYIGTLSRSTSLYFGAILWGCNHTLMGFLLGVETLLIRRGSRST
jgi:hypothetical protein